MKGRRAAVEQEVPTDPHRGEVCDSDRAQRKKGDHQTVAIVHGIEPWIVTLAALPLRHQLHAEIEQHDR
jgi:hypothetical protein